MGNINVTPFLIAYFGQTWNRNDSIKYGIGNKEQK